MKKTILLLLSVVVLATSCGKNNEQGPGPIKNQTANFSYGDANETGGIAVAEVIGKEFTMQITKVSGTTVKGLIQVYIDDFKGAGTYNFGDGVRVEGLVGGDDDYWSSEYYINDDLNFSQGKVEVKTLNKDRVVATIDGKLVHIAQNGQIQNTTVTATVDYFRSGQ